MIIQKFGGTSVGSPERIRSVADLINTGETKIVVLSAMSGTTNKLVEISDYLYKKNFDTANELIYKLETIYHKVIEELYSKKESKEEAMRVIGDIFNTLKAHVGKSFSEKNEKVILAQGELLSTNMFQIYLKEIGLKTALLPALEYMKTNENAEPDYAFIKTALKKMIDGHSGVNLFVTQGFICRNYMGDVDNLQRGGSDYSASIVGAAINSQSIEIWTDIDGMHNNDPRIVQNTHSIESLSFDEAAELAYFGAKILHPTSVLPAKFADIPVWLKNTMNPAAKGTLITKEPRITGVKAIAAKDNITSIKIKSGRMLLAYGFLTKVFEIFAKHKTPIDMITTSEVGVAVTIDNKKAINEIIEELKEYGQVSICEEQTIICIVGYMLSESKDVMKKVFTALDGIPIQMISYGGSMHNVSVLVNQKDKNNTLIKLNEHLF